MRRVLQYATENFGIPGFAPSAGRAGSHGTVPFRIMIADTGAEQDQAASGETRRAHFSQAGQVAGGLQIVGQDPHRGRRLGQGVDIVDLGRHRLEACGPDPIPDLGSAQLPFDDQDHEAALRPGLVFGRYRFLIPPPEPDLASPRILPTRLGGSLIRGGENVLQKFGEGFQPAVEIVGPQGRIFLDGAHQAVEASSQ